MRNATAEDQSVYERGRSNAEGSLRLVHVRCTRRSVAEFNSFATSGVDFFIQSSCCHASRSQLTLGSAEELAIIIAASHI
jgi:hypothetical protein